MVGSTLRALDAEPPFDRFVFSDLLLRNFRSLNDLQNAYPERSIETHRGDANSITKKVLETINWKTSRAVLFLDPAGAQVDWETLKSISATGAIDMWYLFPSGAVMRMMTRSGNIPTDWKACLDRLLGTNDWEAEFYKSSRQLGLFSEPENRERSVSIDGIETYLVNRLETIFPYVVKRCLTLHNSRNSPLFSLCFAAANSGKGGELAHRLASAIIK